MFRKMICLASALIAACLSIMPQPVKSALYRYNTPSTENIRNVKAHKLLTSLPEENIYLYAVDWKEEQLKHSGIYKEVLLDIKGKRKYFPCWEVDTAESYKPKLILSDINNDGKKELIVISTSGTGTGVHIDNVHVFNVDTFSDIHVANSIETIYRNVKTNITKGNGIVTISINISGNVFTAKAKESSAELWLNDVYFGNRIQYYVADNKLYAKVDAQVGASLFAGETTIDYVFRNKMLDTDNITFRGFNDMNLFIWDRQ